MLSRCPGARAGETARPVCLINRDVTLFPKHYTRERKQVDMRKPRFENLAPFTKLLGLNISKVEEGYCQGSLEVDDKLKNIHEAANGEVVKIMHGGVISMLADTCMAFALASSLDENELPRTLEIKVSYFVAVISGVLTCESKIAHKGGTFAAMESEITNSGRLVAKATATFGIVKANRG